MKIALAHIGRMVFAPEGHLQFPAMIVKVQKEKERLDVYLIKQNHHGVGILKKDVSVTRCTEIEDDNKGINRWKGRISNLTVGDVEEYPCLEKLM